MHVTELDAADELLERIERARDEWAAAATRTAPALWRIAERWANSPDEARTIVDHLVA